jgi:fructokinase
MTVIAAVEGGGTTFVVAIAELSDLSVIERAEFPTTTPEETLGACAAWLKDKEYAALGVACFGPVDLDKASKSYGHITTTPKPGWQHTDVLAPLRAVRPDAPIMFDTDVNAPALAEWRRGSASATDAGAPPHSSCAYITVGTGIGVGLVVNGKTVHGLMHPEGGHVAVPRHIKDGRFAGSNPRDTFGGLCAENLGCSLALAKRAGLASTSELASLPDDHEVWDIAAHYLGALCANIVLLVSPDRIVLSGGVMKRATLFPKVRAAMQRNLNGYLQLPQLTTQAGVDAYVGPSAWGNNAGLVGALTLAKEALAQARPARRRVESLLGAEIVAPAPSWGAAAAAACAGVAVGWLAARRR